MSEASGRAQMERRLIERGLEDESFRQRLLEEPRAALEEELGASLPAEVQIRVVEESADTIYLVLPSASALVGDRGGELSDRNLELVAGGDVAVTWDPEAGAGHFCSY